MNDMIELTLKTQQSVILPETICAWLREGKQVALEIKGEQLIAREVPRSALTSSETAPEYSFDAQGFAERTAGKTFDELLHEGKRDAQKLLDDQGIASMALYLSELMVQSIETQRTVRILSIAGKRICCISKHPSCLPIHWQEQKNRNDAKRRVACSKNSGVASFAQSHRFTP